MLPVSNKPDGFCGRRVTLKKKNALYGFCGRRVTVKKKNASHRRVQELCESRSR